MDGILAYSIFAYGDRLFVENNDDGHGDERLADKIKSLGARPGAPEIPVDLEDEEKAVVLGLEFFSRASPSMLRHFNLSEILMRVVEVKGFLERHAKEFHHGKQSCIVKMRHDLMMEFYENILIGARGRGVLGYREFSMLSAIRGILGRSAEPKRITRDRIRAASLGYISTRPLFDEAGKLTAKGVEIIRARSDYKTLPRPKEKPEGGPWTVEQVRQTTDLLFERKFFSRITELHRLTWYSLSMDNDQLVQHIKTRVGKASRVEEARLQSKNLDSHLAARSGMKKAPVLKLLRPIKDGNSNASGGPIITPPTKMAAELPTTIPTECPTTIPTHAPTLTSPSNMDLLTCSSTSPSICPVSPKPVLSPVKGEGNSVEQGSSDEKPTAPEKATAPTQSNGSSDVSFGARNCDDATPANQVPLDWAREHLGTCPINYHGREDKIVQAWRATLAARGWPRLRKGWRTSLAVFADENQRQFERALRASAAA